MNKHLRPGILETFVFYHGGLAAVVIFALCIVTGVFLSFVLCSWLNAEFFPDMRLSTLFEYTINDPHCCPIKTQVTNSPNSSN